MDGKPVAGRPFDGFAETTYNGPRWTGRVELIESQLEIPLHWREPRRIFVNSMSDTWHEKLPLRNIAYIYAMMGFCRQHTFQVLTKRPENRLAAMNSGRFRELVERWYGDILERRVELPEEAPDLSWPLSNVWEGVSVEDRKHLSRIDQLRETPAALRFLSLEPLLEDLGQLDLRGIGWCVIGGESGPGARPCDIAWIRSIVSQCKAANVRCFVKQVGAQACYRDPLEGLGFDAEALDKHLGDDRVFLRLRSRKGGNPEEWSYDLRVREIPEVTR